MVWLAEHVAQLGKRFGTRGQTSSEGQGEGHNEKAKIGRAPSSLMQSLDTWSLSLMMESR